MRAEADLEQRAAAGGVRSTRVAVVRLGGLTDDCEAEPRPGQLAGLIGAIEALEHLGQILRLKPGAVVSTVSTPSCRLTSISPPGGLHLRAFSSEVGHGARYPVGLPLTIVGSSFASTRTSPRRRVRSTACSTI